MTVIGLAQAQENAQSENEVGKAIAILDASSARTYSSNARELLRSVLATPADSPIRRKANAYLKEQAGIIAYAGVPSAKQSLTCDGRTVLCQAGPPIADQQMLPTSKETGLLALDAATCRVLWQHIDGKDYNAFGLAGGLAIAGTDTAMCNAWGVSGDGHVTVYSARTGKKFSSGQWGNAGLEFNRPLQNYDNATHWQFRGIVTSESDQDDGEPKVTFLSVKDNKLACLDARRGKVVWEKHLSDNRLVRRGNLGVSAHDAGDTLFVAYPTKTGTVVSSRRWASGDVIWERVFNGITTVWGTALFCKWKGDYWLSGHGADSMWRISPCRDNPVKRHIGGPDRIRSFSVNHLDNVLSIRFDDNHIKHPEWKWQREPRGRALFPWITPRAFSKVTALEIFSMWRATGDGTAQIIYLRDPKMILTVDKVKFLNWILSKRPDHLAAIRRAEPVAYKEPGRLTRDERQEITRLIRQLGAQRAEERQTAQKQLISLGVKVIPLIRAATSSEDPEVRIRALYVLQWVRDGGSTP